MSRLFFPLCGAFFKGWALRESETEGPGGFSEMFLDICRELPLETWAGLCSELVEASSSRAPDHPLLLAHVREHAQALVEAFFKSTEGPFFVDKGAVLL